MDYHWILFDADGTLFDFSRAETAALTAAFAEEDLSFEDRHLELYRQVNASIWQELERGEIEREELKVRRFERLFEAAELEIDAQAFGARYLKCLAARSDLIAGAEEILRRLRGKVRMILLTNGLKDVQRPRLAGSPIEGYFEDVVISEEVGAVKPDPEIFDVAFSRMGQPNKNKVLIVGDSLTSDIRGGSDYGIDTCWYNPAGETCELEVAISVTKSASSTSWRGSSASVEAATRRPRLSPLPPPRPPARCLPGAGRSTPTTL